MSVLQDISNWSVPRSNHLVAAFHYASGELVACSGQDDVAAHEESAQKTFAIWKVAQSLPDAALMIVKAQERIFLGARNGGLIVEGQNALNIGLFRAASKQLPAATFKNATTHYLTSEDRFRRAFWAIISRFHATVLPRTFVFDLAGVSGTVRIKDGVLEFAGDFSNPADFVGELRAASAVEEGVSYSLIAHQDTEDQTGYTLAELLGQIVQVSDKDTFVFDADGWPVSIPDGAEFRMVQNLSSIASALRAQGGDGTTLSILSEANLPSLTGKSLPDGKVEFRLR